MREGSERIRGFRGRETPEDPKDCQSGSSLGLFDESIFIAHVFSHDLGPVPGFSRPREHIRGDLRLCSPSEQD